MDTLAQSLALDPTVARTIVSALAVVAVTLFSLVTFEHGIREMLDDLRNRGREEPRQAAVPSRRA